MKRKLSKIVWLIVFCCIVLIGGVFSQMGIKRKGMQ